MQHGFTGLRLDSVRLVNPDVAVGEREKVIEQASNMLANGQHIILYSAQGPDDPAIATTRDYATHNGLDNAGARLGKQQGLILRALLERHPDIKRVCVAGGDTCSHAAQQLDIFALETITPIAPGGPLCRASSHNPRFDRLEIVLKGGQVGKADFYGLVLRGGKASA
jgi:uncharacterized protein YgbK (DUF1537 family)